MKFDIEYLEKLAKILTDNDLSEITLESGEDAVVIKKSAISGGMPAVTSVPTQVALPVQKAPEETKKDETPEDKGHPITSPMVGTFYVAPGEGEEPFVKQGQRISKGQVVCIIEAMKLMNKIESEFAGTVTEVCVENGTTVEYGQTLMYVK